MTEYIQKSNHRLFNVCVTIHWVLEILLVVLMLYANLYPEMFEGYLLLSFFVFLYGMSFIASRYGHKIAVRNYNTIIILPKSCNNILTLPIVLLAINLLNIVETPIVFLIITSAASILYVIIRYSIRVIKIMKNR